MVCRVRGKLASPFASSAVAIVSTACRYPVPMAVPPPPRASEEVRAELHALEGSETCKATRDFLLDEVSPYFGAIDALNR